MPHRIRRLTAPLVLVGLLLGLAHPAFAASKQSYEVEAQSSAVPMMFDILVMRPLGLVATLAGTVFYVVPVAPIMALTRPADIGKPIGPMIGAPARFTFSDPIGNHP